MNEPEVREVDSPDLPLLAEALGDEPYFIERLDRQKNGDGMLFAAWLGRLPVGDVYLWLQEAEEEPIRLHLPEVPLLTHLEVLPEYRNQGIGTRLIAAVEDHVRNLGHPRIALAVRTDNEQARRLYERLGYQDWGHGKVECQVATMPNGHVKNETCDVLYRDVNSVQSGPTALSHGARCNGRRSPVPAGIRPSTAS